MSTLLLFFIIINFIAGFLAAYEFLKKTIKPYDRFFFGMAMISNLSVAVYLTFTFFGE